MMGMSRVKMYISVDSRQRQVVVVLVAGWALGLTCCPPLRTPSADPEHSNQVIIIIKGHSLRRACLQPATDTQSSKPRPPTTQIKW